MCVTAKSHAQWESPFSHYWEAKSYYNPSFAGETDHIKTVAFYRTQLSDIKDAPQQVAVTIDMPFQFLQQRHGSGIVAYTESTGKSRNSLLAAQYTFKQQLGNSGILNIGVQAGIFNLEYDKRSLNLITDTVQNKQQLLNVNLTDKQVVDLAVGISWIGNRFYAGFSIMHLNKPGFYISQGYSDSFQQTKLSSGSDSIRSHIPRSFNFIAGYNISLFNSLEIQPMVWLLHDENQTQTQATVQLEYDKRFSGGFSLLSDNGYSIFAGANIKGFRFGYAYTIYNKGIWKESNGNNELFLRYNFPLDGFKPKIQAHKSIRLL